MWLDEKLNPSDEVILPRELKIRSYIQLSNGKARALDNSGRTIHTLEKDASGIYRSVSESEVDFTRQLISDPVLGMVSYTDNSLRVLSEGKKLQLSLIESIDKDLLEVPGVKKPQVSDYRIMDITGDGKLDVLVMDYPHKRLTLLVKKDNHYRRVFSWQIFDDKKYPYTGGETNKYASSEPREVLSGDFDGDGYRDLVLMCHDRIIYYLARKEVKK